MTENNSQQHRYIVETVDVPATFIKTLYWRSRVNLSQKSKPTAAVRLLHRIKRKINIAKKSSAVGYLAKKRIGAIKRTGVLRKISRIGRVLFKPEKAIRYKIRNTTRNVARHIADKFTGSSGYWK